jgi:hypothetical protein
MTMEVALLCIAAASSTVAWVLMVFPPEQRVPKWGIPILSVLDRILKRLDMVEARIAVPKLDEPARRRELAERAVAYADQLGGPRAQRLAHALAAMRLLAPQGSEAPPDNIARIEIEAVLARRKPAPAPGTGEKRVAP